MCALQEVRCSDLDAVRHAFRACHARAVGAAVKRVVRLDAVSDHLDIAVLAGWGERVDRTLEAVEGVRVPTGHRDGDRLRVQHDTHKRTHPYSCTYALEGVA